MKLDKEKVLKEGSIKWETDEQYEMLMVLADELVFKWNGGQLPREYKSENKHLCFEDVLTAHICSSTDFNDCLIIDIDDFKNEKIAVHCDTKEKSDKFMKYLESVGVKSLNSYHVYNERTCYEYNERLIYCNKGFFTDNNYIVVDFDQFEIKEKTLNKKMYTFDEINSNKIVVHCPTPNDERLFFKFFKENATEEITQKSRYGSYTCYGIDSSIYSFGSVGFFERNEYKIITTDQLQFKENKMKYELNVENLSAKVIHRKNPCQTKFDNFASYYGWNKNIEWTEEVEEFMIDQDGWIDWLLENDFIKKVVVKIEFDFDSDKIYVFRWVDKLYKFCRIKANNYTCICISDTSMHHGGDYFKSFDEFIEWHSNYTENDSDDRMRLKEFDTLSEAAEWFESKRK